MLILGSISAIQIMIYNTYVARYSVGKKSYPIASTNVGPIEDQSLTDLNFGRMDKIKPLASW